jgi:lipid II:glycine glycyltransferase (peptidoglycan interpeptide bridge formation enzyme)
MLYTFLSPESIDDSELSFWQSHTWKRILERSHQAREVFYFGHVDGTFLLVEIRQLQLGMTGAFVLGPNKSQIASDFPECIAALQDTLRSKWVVLLQVEPVEESGMIESGLWVDQKRNLLMLLLKGSGNRVYKEFLTPYNRVVDLAPSEDEIWAQMKEKGRYHINLAEKRGVTIESVAPTPENIDIWMWLLWDTLARDGFAGNSRAYYEVFLEEIYREYGDGLYFGYADGHVVVAGIFVSTPARTIYYYGASSSDKEDRKKMWSYLLQWYAIREARKKWIPYYDFLGVSDPDNPDDHLKWVSDFKEKFWWYLVKLPPKLCIILSWKGRLILLAKTMFRR